VVLLNYIIIGFVSLSNQKLISKHFIQKSLIDLFIVANKKGIIFAYQIQTDEIHYYDSIIAIKNQIIIIYKYHLFYKHTTYYRIKKH
jgi:hypothetical protein